MSFGQLQLEQFTGLTSMPQKAASAWDGAFATEMVGAQFKPLLFSTVVILDKKIPT